MLSFRPTSSDAILDMLMSAMLAVVLCVPPCMVLGGSGVPSVLPVSELSTISDRVETHSLRRAAAEGTGSESSGGRWIGVCCVDGACGGLEAARSASWSAEELLMVVVDGVIL